MKNKFILFSLLFCLVSCTNPFTPIEPGPTDEYEGGDLYIFSLNDLHGGVEYVDGSYAGLSKVSATLNGLRNTQGSDNVVFLSAGDNYQGTMLSNLSYGKVVIDCFNEMKCDGSTIGNHEFDWGIDKIHNYWDKDLSNGEANFGIGACNIAYSTNNKDVEWIPDYFVVQKGQIKVGIIPSIGQGQETQILGTMVRDYTFLNPTPIIKELAFKLRNTEKCDVVIALMHEDGEITNQEIAQFDKLHRVDAIINAHTHQREKFEYVQSSGSPKLVSVQAGNNSNYYGLIKLTLDKDKKVVRAESNYHKVSLTISDDQKINSIINNYYSEIEDVKNQVLGVFGESVSYKSQLYKWLGEVILKSTGVEVSITNQGGLRTLSKTYYKGDAITYGELYSLYPFDNQLMLVEVEGSILSSWINKYSDGNIITYKDGITIYSGVKYQVAIIDYLAEKSYNEYYFKNDTYHNSNIALRDMLKADIELQYKTNGYFMPSNGAIINKVI